MTTKADPTMHERAEFLKDISNDVIATAPDGYRCDIGFGLWSDSVFVNVTRLKDFKTLTSIVDTDWVDSESTKSAMCEAATNLLTKMNQS